MSKPSTRNITDWFKPKAAAPQRAGGQPTSQRQRSVSPAVVNENSTQQDEHPPKRQRTSEGGRWLSPSPTPSPSTVVASSAEQPQALMAQLSDANVSFSSMRSTSSKRITVSTGQEVVRGSDTETDDELEDLETILNKDKPKPKSAAIHNRMNEAKLANIMPRKQEQKKYTISLSSLVEEKRQQTAMEVKIAEAQANLHKTSTAHSGAPSAIPRKEDIKAVLIEANSADDGGKARRVMDALDRTEAFERNDVWHFFESQPQKAPKNPFPRIVHPNAMLQTTLNDPQRRQQAFMSGFIQRIADRVPLPEELLSWLMIEVCRESKDFLLAAYIETLSQAASSESSCLAESSLMQCFQVLGVRSDALDFQGLVRHSREPSTVYMSSGRPNLQAFVQLLQKVCVKLPLPSKDLALHFLVRASFDQGVLSDASMRIQIEKCFRDLLDTYEEGTELDDAFTRVAKAIFESIKTPSLRQQLLTALPASGFRTHHFRRLLAVAFALDKARHLDTSLHNPALTARMLLLFEKGSALRITSATDYVELRARISMLDMALDAGFDDFAFLEDEDKQAEKAFNDNVDRLTNAVRDLTARIVDAGAAHMSRTEAKVVAERLAQRLEFAVRTREKPPKDWFGELDKQEKRDFMKGWIAAKGEEKGDAQLSEITPTPNQQGDSEALPVTPLKPRSPSPKPLDALDGHAEKDEGQVPSSTPGTARKVAIRSSTINPIAKRGKNRMLLMKF